MAFSQHPGDLERELAVSDGGVGNGEGDGNSGGGRGGRRGRGGKGGRSNKGGKSGGSRRRKPGQGGGGNAGGGSSGGGGGGGDKLTSPQNPQVKGLIRLRHRRARDQQGLTVIEEPLVLRRAWEAGYPLQSVFYCPEQMSSAAKDLLEDLRAAVQVGQTDVKLVELGVNLLRKAAYRDQPDGLLAIAPQQRKGLDDLVLRPDSLLLVLENVEKPGNVGAVLRIADGVGADAVLVAGEGTDLYNPNVLRASRGAFFSVPAVHCHVGEARDYLHEKGLRVLATTPAADLTYTEADLAGPVALVLGCEHDGLSEAWLKDEGSEAVRIPMVGRGDSLNVSTAAAVILYEAVRQRSLPATA
jgi:TrmH family RNA methyltransferase